jgi:hypothetical protein
MHSCYRYALFVLQNPADLEKVQGLHSEICPASSHDAYQAISIKAEVPSEAEAEEDPLAITFPGGIKAEPEVSCVSMLVLGSFKNTGIPFFTNFCCSEQHIFVGILFLQKQRNTHTALGKWGEIDITIRVHLPTIPVCLCALF